MQDYNNEERKEEEIDGNRKTGPNLFFSGEGGSVIRASNSGIQRKEMVEIKATTRDYNQKIPPQEDEGEGECGGEPGGSTESADPDCASSVVTSLSSTSPSNRASVSARYVARLMSHLASHSESTVT